jgi:hypothetical protein
LGRGGLTKRGGKQCYKQAGNQRELVRPRKPGSKAETLRGTNPSRNWLAETGTQAILLAEA